MITEKNFIIRLKKKKEDAMAYVIDEYLGLIKGIVVNKLGSQDDKGLIDECINDVLLNIWENASQFKGDQKDFRKWLSVVAKYTAVDYFRKRVRVENKEQLTESFSETRVLSNDMLYEIILKEDSEELLSLLDCLSKDDREIFIMKYFLDMQNVEIAEKLSMTKAAIDNRIYRGKQLLRKEVNFDLQEVVV